MYIQNFSGGEPLDPLPAWEEFHIPQTPGYDPPPNVMLNPSLGGSFYVVHIW